MWITLYLELGSGNIVIQQRVPAGRGTPVAFVSHQGVCLTDGHHPPSEVSVPPTSTCAETRWSKKCDTGFHLKTPQFNFNTPLLRASAFIPKLVWFCHHGLNNGSKKN